MHKMVVFAKAIPGQVDALASWYDEQHINDLLAGEGIQGDAPEVIAVHHGSSVDVPRMGVAVAEWCRHQLMK